MSGTSTEVSAKANRRKFTAAYKEKIVREAEGCTERGAVGALLRREGIYSGLLQKWRRLVEKTRVEALAPKKRGPVAHGIDPRDEVIAQMGKEIAKLTGKLKKAETIIDFQKKLSELLGIMLPTDERLSK
jgi:transposase-like protein